MVTRLDRASRSTRDFLNTLAMIAILHSYGWSSSCFIAIKVKGEMTGRETAKVAVLWRGDSQARRNATPGNNRFHRIFEELAALGIHAEPAVYADDIACEVREQLLKVDGVLVWVDPIHQGQTRTVLDAMLRDVASRGPWVSAHPDVILKTGVKEVVLHRTKHLGWGTDTHLYRTARKISEQYNTRARARGAMRRKPIQLPPICRHYGHRVAEP